MNIFRWRQQFSLRFNPSADAWSRNLVWLIGEIEKHWESTISDCCGEDRELNSTDSRELKNSWPRIRSQDVAYDLCHIRLTEVLRTEQRAFVTNESTLGRTWEQIVGTISKFTANWMGCSRIYKTTLSQFFKTWQDWACAKRALWGSFRKNCIDCWKKRTSGLGKGWMSAF